MSTTNPHCLRDIMRSTQAIDNINLNQEDMMVLHMEESKHSTLCKKKSTKLCRREYFREDK